MKKIVKVLLAFLLLGLIFTSLTGCSKKDVLTGTWESKTDELKSSWIFDGKGGCTLKNDYFTGEGTYSINDKQVTIKLKDWEKEKLYDFAIDGDKLTLTATDDYSPSYQLDKAK